MSGSRWVEATHERAALGQLLEHRLGERGAVVGVGARAQLVEQDERAVVHALEHLAELLDEGGEGREVLGHALVVADDGEASARSTGSRAPSRAGTWQPDCAMSASRPERLERHRLAARVGPGDDEQRAARRRARGPSGTTGRLPASCPAPARGAAGCARRASDHVALVADRGLDRFHALGERARARRPGRARRCPSTRASSSGRRRAHRVGQRGQDAEDLGLLLARRLDEVVVGLDHRLRLDEERGPALRAVVDDAAQRGSWPPRGSAARSGRGGP